MVAGSLVPRSTGVSGSKVLGTTVVSGLSGCPVPSATVVVGFVAPRLTGVSGSKVLGSTVVSGLSMLKTEQRYSSSANVCPIKQL